MPWMKIEIPEEQARSFWGLLGPQFGSVVKPIASSLSSDKAAIYGNGGKQDNDRDTIFYLSPFAAALLKPVTPFPFVSCERPETGTVRVLDGSPLAIDTAWVELPDSERPYPDDDNGDAQP